MKTQFLFLAALAALWIVPGAAADDRSEAGENAARLKAIEQKLAGAQYDLRYKFHAGETLRHKVVQRVTVETTIKGTTQTAKTRSISTKTWKVTGVDASGNMTFVHMVEDVDMWNEISMRKPVSYNSKTDKEPPPGYEDVAKSVGVPLAEVTIDPHGNEVARKILRPQIGLTGRIVIPMPPKPVRIGQAWNVPHEVAIRQQDGRVKRVKTRQQYTLKTVDGDVAAISVHTQILTPVDDPYVKVQLVQRLTQGELQFDMAAGRVVGQKLDLDEQVIGFNGADSLMEYVGRFTEELLGADAKTAAKPASPAETRRAASPADRDKVPQLRR